MFPFRLSTGIALLVAILFGLAATAPVEAGSIGFRNDLKVPIIVQGVSVVNGVVRQGKKHVLAPGAISWDTVLIAGEKLIVIADAKKPTRTLARQTIQIAAEVEFYSIQLVVQKAGTSGKAANPPDKSAAAPIVSIKLVSTKPLPTELPGGSRPRR